MWPPLIHIAIPVACKKQNIKHLSFKEEKESLGISRRVRMTREGECPCPKCTHDYD